MKVVVVKESKEGKVELTREELQKMLNEAYSEGYSDEKYSGYSTITVPSWHQNWITTTTTDTVTLNS